MLEIIKSLPPGIDGIKASGMVSKEDYQRTIEPMIECARAKGRFLRFLYLFGSDFEGFTPGGAWEDFRVGMRSMRRFAGCAVVTDLAFIRAAVKIVAVLMPCPVRVFTLPNVEEAIAWLRALGASGFSQHFLAEKGVLVLEVQHRLSVDDFDSLSATVDGWIESHGKLDGLVIHARDFPGWEDFPALIHHIRFVKDHHRMIRRIGLAVDGALAKIGPVLVKHFVAAEVKQFSYHEIDDAIAWAEAAEPAPHESGAR